MSAHSPTECPFNRVDLEPHHEPFSWIQWSVLSHTTMRCRICKVTFEEWVVLQIRQLQDVLRVRC